MHMCTRANSDFLPTHSTHFRRGTPASTEYVSGSPQSKTPHVRPKSSVQWRAVTCSGVQWRTMACNDMQWRAMAVLMPDSAGQYLSLAVLGMLCTDKFSHCCTDTKHGRARCATAVPLGAWHATRHLTCRRPHTRIHTRMHTHIRRTQEVAYTIVMATLISIGSIALAGECACRRVVRAGPCVPCVPCVPCYSAPMLQCTHASLPDSQLLLLPCLFSRLAPISQN